jgi:hypothetical protein
MLLAIALCLLATAPLAAAPQAQTTAGPAPAVAGGLEVVYLQGDVAIDGKPAELGQKTGPRIRVVTGPGAVCELVFAGKNALRVGQNAAAAIDLAQVVGVELEKGGVTAVLRKLDRTAAAAAGTDAFRVRTQAAVAGVRGTSLCVWTDGTQTYICACNGTVALESGDGAAIRTITAAHHHGSVFNAAGAAPEEAGLLYHDDAALESLAARIGETIDWTKPD